MLRCVHVPQESRAAAAAAEVGQWRPRSLQQPVNNSNNLVFV